MLYTKKYENKFLPFIKARNEVIITPQQCKLSRDSKIVCLMNRPFLYQI